MFRNNCSCNRQNIPMMGMNYMSGPCMEQEVIEPTITKCAVQEFYHEVPQE